MSKERLYGWLDSQMSNMFYTSNNPHEVPEYVKVNLRDELRHYQEEAFRRFQFMQDDSLLAGISDAGFQRKQLLFNMATGSGKTMIMASLMLYLYKEFNYQNFIFLVNTDAIIKKTHENILNSSSNKYLFNPSGIFIDGEQIVIQAVENFPAVKDKNTIYLKLTTIQKIHGELNKPKENGISLESLEEEDIVILGDEAHHFNASTKKEKEEETSWENTINKMLYLRTNNKLLEFSATINMDDKNISQKYSDKIIYKYDLGEFMNDGYSKNVLRLQSSDNDDEKMKDAILLSQYRKLIARENGISYFKPIIMFKSSKIKISEQKQQYFNFIIESLSVESFSKYISQRKNAVSPNSTLYKVFSYFSDQDLDSIIREIQEDFEARNILNANEKNMLSVDNAVLLNSLENINNPIRVIFAVAKLNEGWDVLNLYDIVRISEGAGVTRNATDSEAQLIGRGARYFSFEYEDEKSYQRRFDNVNSDLRFLETLHYHTINEKGYLANLEKSMNAVNLISSSDETVKFLSTKLKHSFKNSSVYKQGNLFVNETRETKPEDYDSLSKFSISREWETEYIGSIIETDYKGSLKEDTVIQREFGYLTVDKRFLKKSLQRNPFFRFSNLKNYLPLLQSKDELIESKKYLNGVAIKVSLPKGTQIVDLSALEKLEIIDKFLSYCEEKIRNNYKKNIGLKIFKPIKIKDTLRDYETIVPKFDTGYITQRIETHDMRGKNWFIYTDAIMNRLEYELVILIESFIGELESKYNQVFLIRNDEKATRYKLKEFEGPRGFMPDFILYLENESFVYQLFIEPKGEDREKEDLWKQEMLQAINGVDIEIIGENNNVSLFGIKFYNSKNREKFISELSTKVNSGFPLDGRVNLFNEDQ
ncbi:DEAD/DEAH box helicase family protein [Lactococcus lactis]|uniref:DEAD/DEAH box helicase family protein n=1 Tax=Lactococcus lactis TaxID=1358 RepID=UPI000BA5B8C1|nr:DEAD/DEAH box helicase family protein [Lactococcus lactis]PAK67807.1 type III restriction endonuclease subunit R [Lactococcus lactis]PEN17739.1 type III restriction endonuclease subunit R [Lactococcus lactis]TYR17211.1 DEAD/DEAH box helicase [Lactococcus lactis subsp. lactis bv. diacetylactis]